MTTTVERTPARGAQRRRGASPVQNIANNSSPPSSGGGYRAARYARRGLLWQESSLPRVRRCGRLKTSGQGVGVRLSPEGSAGFSGVQTCGSVWADPVCNAKVMARRAVEVGSAVGLWQVEPARGVLFGTLTMRHHRGQRLSDLWDALSAAWGSVTSGKQWVNDRSRYGVAGWCRVVETTWGEHGWHVHVHVLFFVDDDQAVDVDALQARLFGRWSRALVRRGLAAPLALGQDLRRLSGPADEALGAYFTKATDDGHRIGLEVTASQSKTTRAGHGTRTPWSFLDGIEAGDADELRRWIEWEKASHGRRQITWSQGFRKRLGLLAEKSDEEVAAEEVGTETDTLVVITSEGWSVLCREPVRLATVLDVTEAGGLVALRTLLDGWGVAYEAGWGPSERRRTAALAARTDSQETTS